MAIEVETVDIGARLQLVLADGDDVGVAGDFLPHVLLGIEVVARLVDVGQLHGVPEFHLAGVRRFLADDQLEQGRDLPAPFRPGRPIFAPVKKLSEMSLMIWWYGG